MADDEQRRRKAALAVEEPPELGDDALQAAAEEDEEEDSRFASIFSDRRRIGGVLAVIALAIVGIYFVFPKVVGLDDSLDRMSEATWYWIVIAVAFNIAAFAAYVALFRGILGGRHDDELHRRLGVKASYEITMAGLAATRLFSAGGAGGLVLTYWALRKAGLERRRSACRMVAFLIPVSYTHLTLPTKRIV